MKTKLLGAVATLAFFGVVSPACSSTCPINDSCGFLYSGGTYTTLGPSGSTSTIASGINDADQIVGFYGTSTSIAYGFLYSGGTYTTLSGPSGNAGTFPYGINNKGQIVGAYGTGSGPSPLGFLYSGGTYTTLSTGSIFTVAQGINNKGQIVGAYSNSIPEDLGVYAFLHSGGTYTSFGVPGSCAR